MYQEFDYTKENLLVVDDEPSVLGVVTELLLNLGFNVDSAGNGKEALQLLRNKNHSILVTDINMPELNGIELIKGIKKEIPEINIIAMTAYDKDYTYMSVINAGADDFVIKPFNIDEMEAKIRRILIERHIRQELSRLSITDNLTGLYNRRHFYNQLKKEMQRADRQNRPLSLIILDLNGFKKYNDTHGHLAGDKLLSEAGEIINSKIRCKVDMAFRYGGDEFAVILVEAGEDIAREISDRIKKRFKDNRKVTASTGIATYSRGMGPEDFVLKADKELYKEKRG